jgi:hypothetical protein
MMTRIVRRSRGRIRGRIGIRISIRLGGMRELGEEGLACKFKDDGM